LRQLPKIRVGNSPILVGLSRKSMIGAITGRPVDERLAGSLATAVLAAQNGANLIRVHDVVESADVLSILDAYGTL
jgi:dihydropteroate synthase